jgi:hypothetical protein
VKPEVSNAYVLVRNLQSSATCLDFGEFIVSRVGLRFTELRQFFSAVDVEAKDWILEKAYGPMDSPIERIPIDIEEILLLLRLFHTGELAFIKLVMEVLGSGVPREQLFVTTKLWVQDASYEGAKRAV